MRPDLANLCESCGAAGTPGYYVGRSSRTLCDDCAVQAVQAGFDVSTDQGEPGPAGSGSA